MYIQGYSLKCTEKNNLISYISVTSLTKCFHEGIKIKFRIFRRLLHSIDRYFIKRSGSRGYIKTFCQTLNNILVFQNPYLYVTQNNSTILHFFVESQKCVRKALSSGGGQSGREGHGRFKVHFSGRSFFMLLRRDNAIKV